MELFSPIKRQYIMQKIINNMNEISKPVSTSPMKRRIRIQSNRVDYRKNRSLIENDSSRQFTEPNNTDTQLKSQRRPQNHSQPKRKLSEDQIQSKLHPKSPPVLPILANRSFEITFQNPFFGQFSQRKAYSRPTEFQALVYKRKRDF